MRTTLISASELASLLGDPALSIVDCRFSLADTEAGRRAYAAGHIPGASYAHLDEDLSGPVVAGRTGRHPLPEPDAFAERLARWGIDDPAQVVVYDGGDAGIASRLWWMLRWVGHDQVSVLDGGWAAWTAGGYPTTVEVPARAPAHFTARPRPELVVSAAEVERVRELAGYRLLDARSGERFRGDVEPIDRVAGHIPGARSLPLSDNLEGGRFRAKTELHMRITAALAGVTPERAIAYCGSGVTACQLILAAEHAGLSGMRLYAGSWSEWINDPSRPIARGD